MYSTGRGIFVKDDTMEDGLPAGNPSPILGIAPNAPRYLTNADLAAYGPLIGSAAWLALHAGGNLDALIVGTITRDANGTATSAGVTWPDGTTGTYTGTASTTTPGAVDTFTVTYAPAGGTTRTVTQPAVTRNASGAVTVRPAMTIA